MAHEFSKSEILELCALTEDFAAKVLCPKVESYGVKPEEMQDAIGATLGACGAAAKMEVTKYLKGEKRWYVDEIPDEDTPAKEEPDPDDDLFKEIPALITKIIMAAKKHANGDAQDFHSTLASAALTIITTGGKGTAMAAAIGLNGVITGRVKLD
jgi:hypothetical protein